MMFVDSHAHLDFPTSPHNSGLRGTSVDGLKSILVRAKYAGVGKIVTIGTSLSSSTKAIEIAEKHSSDDLKIYATVGLHPKDANKEIDRFGLLSCFKTVKQLAQSSEKIVAIGECGLDYYVTSDPSFAKVFDPEDSDRRASESKQLTTDEDKESQRELFKAQIELATELKLPLVIHCRNAWDEIFDLLRNAINYSSSGAKRSPEVPLNKKDEFSINSNNIIRGLFHSWTGDLKAMKKALDLGFYISFSGIVTFKNAKGVQEVTEAVPLEKILIETDSPFLAPEPIRGQKNEPKNVRIIAEFLAKVRDQSVNDISNQTSANAQKLFNLL